MHLRVAHHRYSSLGRMKILLDAAEISLKILETEINKNCYNKFQSISNPKILYKT